MKDLIEKINSTPAYPYGVRIDFRDKLTQWFDPVSKVTIDGNTLSIDTNLEYKFNLLTVKDVEYYPICEYCGYELILYENETCLRCGR